MTVQTRPTKPLMATLPMARPARARGWRGRIILLSLLIHVLILVALLLGLRETPPPSSGAPSQISMVFEPSDTPKIPGLEKAPNPGTLPSQTVPPDPHATAPSSGTADGSPATTPGARVPVSPEARPAPRTPSLATTPGASKETETAHAPTPPPPPEKLPETPSELGQKQAALVPLKPPSPRPATPRQAAPASPFGGSLYVPNMSFGNGPAARAATAAARPGPSVDLPPGASSERTAAGMLTQMARAREADPGEDFYASLMRWWLEHRFYPPEAAKLEQQGDVGISVVVDRYGHMSHIVLESRSGSVYLDMAGQSTWANGRVAPVPERLGLDHLTIDINMHYYLVYR